MNRIFTLLLFTVVFGVQGFSQNHINYEKDSRWFLGINGGATWTTQTETPFTLKPAWGLTLGKSIWMNPNNFFSVDIRGRFLAADIAGQGTNQYTLDSTSSAPDFYGSSLDTYRDSIGYFVPNYETRLYSGSIELVLNTNRLREKSGLNFYLFGGVGIKGYRTAADLFEGDTLSANIYDYNDFGSLSSKSNILSQQDGKYETDLVGSKGNMEVTWMPSVGAGLSYQITPQIALGLEHKMTWTRTNNFDGMPNNYSGGASNLNDVYHYSGVSLKFHLWGGTKEEPEDEDIVEDDPIKDDPVVNEVVSQTPKTKKKPIVDIYDPNVSPYTVKEELFTLRANIYYVENKSNITFKQNGVVSNSFSYNASTDKFFSNVVLQPGQNIFEITGVNEAGEDYESTIIIYEKEVEEKRPPIVSITNPPFSPYGTNSSTFGLNATVLQVDSKSQITVYLNGVILNTFSYNLSSKVLNANLNLMQGVNNVTVSATNDVGSDSKTVQINYEKPREDPPPVVDFVSPSSDPYLAVDPDYLVEATVLNVVSKSFITVNVNGFKTDLFSYNPSTKTLKLNVNLNEGANVIQIKGVNDVGYDVENTTIFYHKPEVPRPPKVTFIDPNIDPITVYGPNYKVTAKVEHVDGASNIDLKINGVPTSLFVYSPSSNLMEFNTNLLVGANVIEIKGTNEYGSDIEATTIIYKKEIKKAPPVVNITYPSIDNKVFLAPNLTLTANVLHVENASNIQVKVNGVPTSSFSYNTLTKVLTLPLTLNVGSNTIQITGTNSAGSDSDTRIILHQPPKVPKPPTVDITSPASTPHLVSTPDFVFTANTSNIDSKDQIVLTLNSSMIPSSAYSFTSTNQIIYNAELIPGNNVFNVSVSNDDGSDDDLAIVVYEKEDEPCIIPTVGYISPVPYSTVDEANQKIDAQINNWTTGTTIELKLNSVSVGYMSFNESTSIASKDVTLNEGSNSLKVIVTNNCGTNQSTFTLNYEKPDAPCNAPILNVVGDNSFTTLEESVSLTAGATNVSEKEQIVVTLNGSGIPFTFDSGTGTITIPTDLAVGNNALIVTATTDCGSAVTSFHVEREECKEPLISSVSPATSSTTEETSSNISATIANVTSAEITLLVNGISQPFSYNATSSSMTATADLNIGDNLIEIIATNACGTQKKEITVKRKDPCSEIVYNLISPSVTEMVSADESFNVQLNATGLSDASEISVKFNGSDKDFTFDAVTGDITISGITLNDGANTIKVSMTNPCSSKSVDYTINYDGCEAPVIVINGITDGMTVASEELLFSADISNVNSASDITLNLNGTAIDFTYDPVAKVLTAPIVLTEGSNNIEIIVNGCETASKEIKVNYEIPCPDITTGLMAPSATDQTVVESDYSIKLTVDGVESSSQISVKQNGSTIPFSYSTETNIVEINDITLVDGANTIVVNATNECSKGLVTYNVSYDGCAPPVITTGANPSTVNDPNYTFTATVTNISDASNIQFLVNEAPAPFVFDPASGSFTAEVVLNEGITNFVLNANGCETASASGSTTYEIPCEELVYALSVPSTLSTSVSDPTYSIELVAQNVSAEDILVTVNGSAQDFTYADDLVSISGISLNDGDNAVVVKLKNDCSNETITYNIQHSSCDAPIIDLSANDLSADAASYSLTALVSNIDDASDITLKLNGAVQTFDFNATTGTLTASLTLTEGENVILLEANGCESASDKITVAYEIPCVPLTYSLGSPTSVSKTTEEENITISLNTTEIASKSDISVTVNSSPVDFDFDGGAITIADIALTEGENTVVVNLSNECSNEVVTYTINYAPCKAPTITLNSSTATVSESSYTFIATVLNVSAKSDISLKLNGTAVDFDYNGATHKITSGLTLNEGANSIEVSANGCSSSSASYSVTYNTPCDPISYTLLSPTELSTETETAVVLIKVKVENVAADHISVTHGDSDATFSFLGGKIIYNGTLTPGMNEIVVKMDNDCSSETLTYSINYHKAEEQSHLDCEPDGKGKVTICHYPPGEPDNPQTITISESAVATHVSHHNDYCGPCEEAEQDEPDCEEPSYSFINPSAMSTNSDSETYDFKIKLNNMTSDDEIVIKLNGVIQEHTFNPTTGHVDVSGMTLNDGDNFVNVFFKNDCGQENITPRVRYEAPADYGHLDCEPDNKGKVTICHFPPGQPDNPQTITISKSAVGTHVSHHDDYCGPCEEAEEDEDEGDAGDGGQQSPDLGKFNDCPEDAKGKITICHFPPGQTGNPQTITISKNAVAPHINHHDDYCGPCNEEDLCKEIETTLIAPNKLNSNVSGNITDIRLKIEYIETSGITAVVNGSAHDFNYNPTTEILEMKDVPLNTGNNLVKLTLINDCSNKVVIYRIRSTKSAGSDTDGGTQMSVKPPVITNVNPKSSRIEVTADIYRFKAKVENVKSKNDIGFYVNGQRKTTFIYSSVSGDLSIGLKLNEGTNAIRLTAKNNIKSTERTYYINYKKPASSGGGTVQIQKTPVIKPVVPNKTAVSTTQPKYTIKARVDNVSSKANVQVKVNGRATNSFSFGKGQLTIPLTLRAGSNVVQVTAKNGPKSANKTYRINYKKPSSGGTIKIPPTPKITYVSPRGSKASTKNESYTIKAKVENVNSKSDIKLYVNGKVTSGFTWSSSTKQMVATIKLNSGSNTIKVIAKNGSKTANRTYTIEYQKEVKGQGIKINNDSGGGKKQGTIKQGTRGGG